MYSSYQLQSLIDELLAGANTHTQASSNLRDMSNHLNAIAQDLAHGANTWAGQGAQSFQTTWTQYQSDIGRAATDFESISLVLRTLAGELEAALNLKNEIERLDPLNALARLGSPLPFGLSHDLQAAQNMVDDALQAALNEIIIPADMGASVALDGIILADIAQQAVSPQGAGLQQGIGMLGSIMGDAASIVGPFKNIGPASYAIDIFGVALDFYSGSTHDLPTLESDIVGGVIGAVVGLNPYGLAIEAIAATIQVTSTVNALVQNTVASQFPGILGTLLKDPGSNFQIVASNANIGGVFDDMGKLFVDSDGQVGDPVALAEIIGMSYVARAFGVNVPGEVNPTTLLSDYSNLAVDTGKLVLSPVQLVINGQAAEQDDSLALLDEGIQNLPVSSNIKTSFNTNTLNQIKSTNEIADFFTKPQAIEKVGAGVWDWAKKEHLALL